MGPSFSPLTEALDLGPSGYSPWIVEGAVRLGAHDAFAPATALLAHFTGVAMSAATLRRLTIGAGTAVHQLELAASAAAWAHPAPATAAPDADLPLQVSVDGSMVAVLDAGWREVKLAAIGTRQPNAPLTALSYTATLGDAATFGHEALGELERRGVPEATDVVTVNDGATWIQDWVGLHCPQAGRVLDFAHAAGYLATAAQAAYGQGTDAAQAWFGTQRSALRHGDPDRVLTALAALPPSDDRDTAMGYLTARRDQIAYRDFIARGWPIGSGCVESAHKGVVQARLKGRGMRWSLSGAEGLLALRVVTANDRWAAIWDQVGAHQRAARRMRTAHRRARRVAARQLPTSPAVPPPAPVCPDQSSSAPARPRLVQDGTPTAAHPWRRFHLPGSHRFDHQI